MAEYILAILRSQLMVVFSWGFHKPQRLPNDAGLAFMVDGFLYQGRVEVVYNDGADLFEVRLSDGRIDLYICNSWKHKEIRVLPIEQNIFCSV